MDLKDVLYQMMQENTAAGQPTDLRVGTVTREEPLEITINPATSPLRRRQLCLTEPVIEKKIPVLAHRHRIQTLSHTHANSAGTTTTGLDGSYLGEYALVSEGGGRRPTGGGHCVLGGREEAACQGRFYYPEPQAGGGGQSAPAAGTARAEVHRPVPDF